MKKYKIFTLALSLIAVVSLAFAQAVKKGGAAQVTATQTQTNSMRETMNRDRLASLLAAVGVSVEAGALRPTQAQGSRELLVSWNAPIADKARGEALAEREIAGRALSVVKSRSSDQALSQQRAFELSPTEVLAVAVSSQQELRWWTLMPDPRVLRAETTDAKGAITSNQTLYRSEANFILTIPADQTITEVRLYHPDWNGSEFRLEYLGTLGL